MYIENVDQKIKWNRYSLFFFCSFLKSKLNFFDIVAKRRWSFDEGLSSRVPYESAARTLTQTKTSYAGYTVRQVYFVFHSWDVSMRVVNMF